jgi:signal peptidase II
MSRRVKFFTVAAVLTLFLDQVTKLWARESLEFGRSVPFLGSFWDWELSFNSGSAFGLFQSVGGARWFLTIIGFVACAAIIVILRRTENDRGWIAAALGLVFGGALGNVIDRIAFGKVTDFVLWHVGEHRWPAFNVADAALVAGVIILFFDFGKKKEPRKKV